MAKRLKKWGIFLLAFPIFLSGADKSKKAYELIYEDVQLLKQQILELKDKIDRNSEEIQSVKRQLQEVLALSKLFQAEQASLKEDQKKIPVQYQILLEKLEALNAQLSKYLEGVMDMQRSALPSGEQPEQKEGPPTQAVSSEKKAETVSEEKVPASLPAGVSPQEVYNMARTDYLKGNYKLAIEGFQMYRENFSASPLADDALYWIGECFFSQKQYGNAIDQFNELILSYPQGDKVPAAYLKKGLSLAELGKKEEAIAVFKLLITKYPLEEESKIAQQKLKELEA